MSLLVLMTFFVVVLVKSKCGRFVGLLGPESLSIYEHAETAIFVLIHRDRFRKKVEGRRLGKIIVYDWWEVVEIMMPC